MKKFYDTAYKLGGEKAGLITQSFLGILSDILILSQKTESKMLELYGEGVKNNHEKTEEARLKFEELKKNVG